MKALYFLIKILAENKVSLYFPHSLMITGKYSRKRLKTKLQRLDSKLQEDSNQQIAYESVQIAYESVQIAYESVQIAYESVRKNEILK